MAEDEKTEQATPKKRRDERRKGNVLVSKDITTVVFIFGMFFSLNLLAPYMMERMTGNFAYYFHAGAETSEFGFSDAMLIMRGWIQGMVLIVLPLLLLSILISAGMTFWQTRLLFSLEKLKPKLSNMNPINGIKRMFSLRSLVELVKNLIKVVIIGFLVYINIRGTLDELPSFFDMQVREVIIFACQHILALVWQIGLAFAAIAFLDYQYQRWDHEKKLRMTKHEVKQEYKQMEGDPLIKGHRRQEQLKISRARMMQDVAKADVVIRNPDHFSVALSYDDSENVAPKLLAKGQDYMAFKINEIAAENGIPFVENQLLARSIYKMVEIGQEIMPEHYQAAAEVFAWVYKQNMRKIVT
jgi:flagellar biosynthetic protein FlhB